MIKKVFLMLGIAAMLASCSQNEELFTDKGNNTVQQVTFTLATDEKPQTRATTDGLRYVVAVYDEAGTTEVKQETTFENNSFTIMLPPGTDRVNQTLPPITEPLPITTRPRMVAPA